MWLQTVVRKARPEPSEKEGVRALGEIPAEVEAEIQDLRRRISEFQAAAVHERRSEEVLRDSEERFRKIFEEGPLGMAMSDAFFRFIRANAAFCRMLGYSEKEIESLTFKDITHPDHLEGDAEAIQKLLRGEISVYRTEKRYIRKDRGVIWAELTVSAVRNSAGELQYFLAMVVDITARKQAGQDLAQSELRYKELADALPSGIFETNLEGRVIFANRTALDWFGYSEADLVAGRNIMELLADMDSKRASESFKRVIASGADSTGEYTVKRKDGTTFPVLITVRSTTKNGQPAGVLGTVIDISGRKQTEVALRQSEEYYRSMIENSSDMITVMDKDAVIRYASPSTERLLGYKPEELTGTSGFALMHPDDLKRLSAREDFVKVLGSPGGLAPTVQVRDRHKDGSWRHLEVDARSTVDKDGHLAVIANARDITERTQADCLQNAVYRIAQAADESTTLDNLYRSVHETIGTVMPAGNFYIALYDAAKDMISFPYFVDEVDAPPAPLRPGKGLTEYIIRTGKPLLCDEATDLELRGRGEVEVVGAPSAIWIGVPLIVDKKTIGVMVVQHYSDPKAYGPRELRMLEYVSSQVAKSIERKRAEEALKASETILRVFINALPGPAMLMDRDHSILEINECMAQNLGRTRRELVGRKAFEFLAPEVAAARMPHFAKVVETGQPRVFEDERAGLSFLNYVYPVLDEKKAVARIAVFALDLTARKAAEEALLREKGFSDSIIESLPGAFYCLDGEAAGRRFVRWNTNQEKMLGYSKEEMSRLKPMEIIAVEERAAVTDKFQEVLRNGSSSAEAHLLRSDGQKIPVLLTAARTEIEGRPYILGTAIDIARRKQAEEALRDSEELHRKLLASIPDMIIRTDLKGSILFANEVAIRAGRFSTVSDIVGQNIFDFISREDQDRARASAKLMFEKRVGPREYRFALNGAPTLYEVNGAVLRTPDQTPYGMVFLCRDITERKQAETDLHQSLKKLRATLKAAIDSLASAIEMRDPYTAGHQERVTRLASAIATEMGLAEDRIEGIQIAGIIHDIGKLYVPAEILSKPTKLNELEYSMIKMHSQVGYTILSKIDFPWPIAQIVHQHHEYVNGSGYPRGLTGKDILLEAKILCVADVVEAMSSHRPYRPSLGIQAALEEISQKRGILFDREVVDACLRVFSNQNFKFD